MLSLSSDRRPNPTTARDDGRSWNAIGGGDTLAEAIEWGRESCPRGATWEAVGWEDLYGE